MSININSSVWKNELSREDMKHT